MAHRLRKTAVLIGPRVNITGPKYPIHSVILVISPDWKSSEIEIRSLAVSSVSVTIPLSQGFFTVIFTSMNYSRVKEVFFAFLYSLDLDPCLNVTCYFHGLCKAFGPHDARCVCIDHCPSYHEPVCSSNGTTYDNECLFKQEMCRMRLNFTVQHPGSCEGRAHLLLLMLLIADGGRCIGILSN